MRLATIRTPHGPRAALVQGTTYIDLHATDASLPPTVRELLAAGPAALKAAADVVRAGKPVAYQARDIKLLPPIPDPPKIVCLGLNYSDHAAESGAPIPREPVLFSKYATSLIADGDAIVLPPVSNEVDYEAELVIVVGKGSSRSPATPSATTSRPATGS